MATKALTFGSLFAGIGGLDLGLERSGMICRWQVEIDDYAVRVLEKHWPSVKRYRDIREISDGELEPVDLICGGFPCQDITVQNRNRTGLQGEKSGLWKEMVRILRFLRSRFVLVENVTGILCLCFGEVLGDLAALGFDAEWNCIPASLAGLPQTRSRLFVIAYHPGERMEGIADRSIQRIPKIQGFEDVRRIEDLRRRSDLPPSLFRGNDDGIPDWVDRLRCLGNAVVPQVSEGIGRAIMELAS